MSRPLWKPTPQQVEAANMTAFMRFAAERCAANVQDYAALWRWSVDRREEFWPAIWDFCGVRCSRRCDQVLIDGDKMPGADWFPGARLNFAENLLRFEGDEPAIIAWNEQGLNKRISHTELRQEAARIAAWLRRVGVKKGDRVAAFTPNLPETVITMLAAAAIGATFSSSSPDFGAEAVVERFGQIEPTVLLTADGYAYGGKSYDSLARVREFSRRLPSLRHTLVAPYSTPDPALDGLVQPVSWSSIEPATEPLEFEQLPFDHPLYVLYSSGTTGAPKCIVHGAGGTLLQHLKELVLHTDVGRGDRIFFATTCGWMMWNWLVSGLAAGAAIVLYDGSPSHPNASVLFDMVDVESVSVFGTSAGHITAMEKQNLAPARTHRLTSLRTILSTGSPLSPAGFEYVYNHVKNDVRLSSISGGTDIVSCFALGNPIGPVWPGELQCRGLGMSVEVHDERGAPLVGEKGELTCTKAFPSMPIYFWNDPDGEKYRRAYFDKRSNVWRHGDFAELTPHDGMIIHGRSDAVLNPGGVRIGTAEIYRCVGNIKEVHDSIAVGQEHQGDIRIVLFVRLATEGATLDDDLRKRIRTAIRTGASPRHVPAKILQVPDIPRTRSGKIVEVAVREAIHDRPVPNLGALANPESLHEFRERPELNV